MISTVWIGELEDLSEKLWRETGEVIGLLRRKAHREKSKQKRKEKARLTFRSFILVLVTLLCVFKLDLRCSS